MATAADATAAFSAETDNLNKSAKEAATTSKGAADGVVAVGDASKVATPEVAALAAETTRLTEAQKLSQAYAKQVAMGQMAHNASVAAGNAHLTKMQKALSGVASIGTPAFSKAAFWGAAGVLGLAYEGIKKYTEFNALMTTSITQAGRNINELPYLSKQALNISMQTGQSANDVANAMYRVASGTAGWVEHLKNGRTQIGLTAQQLVDMTKQVSNLTILGNIPAGTQQEQAARVLTAMINSGVRGVGNSSQAAALVNASVGAGDLRMSEMTAAMGRGVLTAAKVNGVSATDAMSYIDLLTSMGTTGSVAGNYVKTALTLLSNPSQIGSRAQEMLGITSGEMGQIIRSQGLGPAAQFLMAHMNQFAPPAFFPKYKGAGGRQGAINMLETWAGGSINNQTIADWSSGVFNKPTNQLTSQQQQELNTLKTMEFVKMFGGAKQLMGVATLLENIPKFMAINSQITSHSTPGYYKHVLNIAESTPQVQFHKMWNTIMADLMNFGKDILPVGLKMTGVLTDVVNGLTKFKVVLIPIVAGIAGMAAIAGISKLAGIMYEGYGAVGGVLNAGDRGVNFLGRIFRNEKMRNYSGKFGKSFRNAYASNKDEILSKTGQQALMDGSVGLGDAMQNAAIKVEEFTAAVSGGTGGSIGNSIANVASGVSSPITSLSQDEASFLRRYSAEGDLAGKSITKAEIRRHFGIVGRGKEDIARVNSLYNKFSGLQFTNKNLTQEGIVSLRNATGDNSIKPFVTSAAGDIPWGTSESIIAKDAARAAASESGGLFSKVGGMFKGILGKIGFGGLAEGGGLLEGGLGMGGMLGMLGGPVGIGMMALPMILGNLPTIAKGISSVANGIGGWIHGLFGGGSSAPHYNMSGVSASSASKRAASQLSANQKEAASLQQKINAGLASGKDVSSYQKKLAQITGSDTSLRGLMGMTYGQTGFNSDYSAMHGTGQLINYFKHYGYSGINASDLQKNSIFKSLPSYVQKQILSKAQSSTNWLGQTTAPHFSTSDLINVLQGTQTSVTSDMAKNFPGYLLAKDPQWFNRQKATIHGINQAKQISGLSSLISQSSGSSGPLSAADNFAALIRGSVIAQHISANDMSLAHGSTGSVQKSYINQAQQATKIAINLEKAAKDLQRKFQLDNSTIKSLASEIASAYKGVNTELGLTAQAFAAAVVSAFNSSSGAIATSINKANMNKLTHS
jgi:hypothetical protein